MADQNKEELLARLARLEKKVDELEKKVQDTSASESVERGTPTQSRSKSHHPEKTETSKWKPENVQAGEQWLNRIGIGLLLIGVAFLFKYSIDQGWLIPPVRSAIGLGIGLVLFISGIQMQTDSTMKQILLGGSIGVFYLTGFATFQLYSFMPSPVIWIFMIVVTLLALSLSLQQDEAVLSIIGTLGALGTPFMLYSGAGNITMLMLYSSLVLAAAAIIYMRKGWKTLLWCIAVGGFVVMVVGVVNISIGTEEPVPSDLWILQAGVVFWMIVSWILPAGREMLTSKDPSRWPDPMMRLDDGTFDENLNYQTSASVHLVVFLVPLFLLGLIIGIWELSMDGAGIASLSIAGVGSLGYLPLKNVRLNKLASTHILLGLVMFTIGFVLLLEGNFLFIVLAAETVALRYIAWQTGDLKVSTSSHILFVIVIFWMLNLLRFTPFGQVPILNIEALSQLAFLVAGGILIPTWLNRPDVKHIYQGVSHVVFLVWLYQTLSVLENGQAWVTVAWGVYAIVLLVLGFIRFGKNMRLVGMGTIFLVVGKLFLVDLTQLQAIWRILLFIGFGAVFLLLGYYWQSKWSEDETGTKLNKLEK
jgi:uncharacterized membrane protein